MPPSASSRFVRFERSAHAPHKGGFPCATCRFGTVREGARRGPPAPKRAKIASHGTPMGAIRNLFTVGYKTCPGWFARKSRGRHFFSYSHLHAVVGALRVPHGAVEFIRWNCLFLEIVTQVVLSDFALCSRSAPGGKVGVLPFPSRSRFLTTRQRAWTRSICRNS